jgi:hypothetical protein
VSSQIRNDRGFGAWRTVAIALAVALAAVPSASPVAAATAATPSDTALLAATDPFARTPAELRLELVFTSGSSGARVPIELWRKGDRLALVRFLAPKDRGKFVLRREGSFWFLAPGAKKPVKLAPALAPSGGAALDDLLSVRPSRDYTIAKVEEVRGLVIFDLVLKDAPVPVGRNPGEASADAPVPADRRPAESVAASAAPSYPVKLRWVADRAKRLPVRAEFRSADDKVTRLVEFKSWKNAAKLEPERLVAKDVARGGQPLEVELVTLEARPVDAKLFDLDDATARAALPPPPAVTPKP